MNKTIAILGVSLAGISGYFIFKGKGISLKAGWNEVNYPGKTQLVETALESIKDYFMVGYHWDPDAGWIILKYSAILEHGWLVQIKVSQDCVWKV